MPTLTNSRSKSRSLFRTRAVLQALAIAAAIVTTSAHAQTGVSDDRVSLPDGPGSLDGVGDNASVNPNMGMMAFTIPVSVPQGVNGFTPGFDLAYSSGGGNGVFGMGWSMESSTIERLTSKGLPSYVSDDLFAADGSNQLVRISDGEPAVYRARFEGGFARYSWHDRGAGDEGYWVVESPDGSFSTYGADRNGTTTETARVRSPDGVFRYMLVDTVDPFGNRVTYDYRYYGSVPLLDFVGWVYGDDDNPRFSVRFEYETREDPIADARGGFNERTAHRATDVRIFSGATQIRRYSFSYEDYAQSGGVSRLTTVERFGRDGGNYGVIYTMEYSRGLAGVCDGVECDAPILTTAGSIGAGFATGRVNLVDLNADSLPDAVYTPPTGAHRIYLAEMDVDGSVSFAAPFDSAVGDSGTFELSSPYSQVIDYDGDGFTDLLDSLSGRVLVNKGTGDWDSVISLGGNPASLPDFAEDFALDGENELTHIRFLDTDGDRLIDVLRSDAVGTSLFRNLGAGGFESVPVQDIEAGFADDATDLADVNGDGLLDPVQLRDGILRYRLNLGRGNWTAWAEMTEMPFDIDEIPFVELEDLNGDGLDDVVLVQGSSVRFALNRNNANFSAEQVITGAGGQPLPNVDDTVTVLYADMNANGSNDIVWVDDNGNVQSLDIFPIRPHLLSRLENGVGYTIDVTYGSMAQQRARDGGAGWDYPAPMATLVVTSLDVYAQADNAELVEHDLVTYSYTGGFYDGVEKQFRGFEVAVLEQQLDIGPFVSRSVFDVGFGENRGHFAGRELTAMLSSNGVELSLRNETIEECAVDDVGITTPPILWACNTATETVKKEHAPEAEWVTFLEEQEFDGYGNITRSVDHGVTAIGGGACEPCTRAAGLMGAPCGAQCLGDEAFEEKDFIAPAAIGGTYLTGLAQELRKFASEGGPQQTTRFYFDGDDFAGLPLGQATAGLLSRMSVEVGGGKDAIDVTRSAFDSFGNQTHELRPGNAADGAFVTRTFYSADGRDVIRSERVVENGDDTLTLAVDYDYEPEFGKVSTTSGRYIMGEGNADVRRNSWTYDEHGRVSSLVTPGNSLSSPAEVYEYDLGSPYTRLITKRRTKVDEALDVEAITCVDGLGRQVQTRVGLEDGNYLVSGYDVFDRAGNAVRAYQGYIDDNGGCGSPPTDIRFTAVDYDGLDREVRVTHPDAAERTTASFRRTEYFPLATKYYNEDDTDPDAPGFDTPTMVFNDGLGRMVRTERQLPEGGLEAFTILYDELGRLRGFIDPDGNEKSQELDLADRVISVRDLDAGDWTFEYNDAGDLIRRIDGRGVVIEREYDSLGRKIAEWDASNRDGTLSEVFYDKHPDCPTDSCTLGAGKTVGSRSQSVDGVVTEGIGYDDKSETIHIARKFGETILRTDRVVDNAGRVVEESFTGGHRLTYTVDTLDRPTSIEGIIDSIRYTETGQVAGWTAANGIETSIGYDDRDELQSITAGSAMEHILTRDRQGNIIGVDDRVAPTQTSMSATYELDSLSRLKVAELAGETITISTDAMLRIRSKTSSLGASSSAHAGDLDYTGSKPRAVTTAGDVSFAYDSGGYATERGSDTIGYDVSGRLSGIERSGETILSIDRDVYGFRTRAQLGNECRHYLGKIFEVRDGATRLKVKVGEDVVAILTSSTESAAFFGVTGTSGAVTGADAFAASSNERPSLLRSAARRLLADVAGDVSFTHQDHLGSTVAVSNAAGDIVERIAYYPFGGVRAASAGETEFVSFTGVDDDNTGYLDFKNRVLSPREGRWLSPDPSFVVLDTSAFESPVEAFSAYAFVANNPTTAVDLDGNVSERTKTAGKWAFRAALLAAGVAATVATAGGGFGAVHVIGAVIGGIVSGVVEFKAQQRSYREAVAAKKTPTSLKKRIAAVAFQSTAGALSGFASGGLSAIGPAFRGTADHIDKRPNPSGRAKKAARVLRAIGFGASAATAVFNPLAVEQTASGALGTFTAFKTAENSAAAGGVAVGVAGAVQTAKSKTAQKRAKKLAKRAKKAAKRAKKALGKRAKKAGAKVKKLIKSAKGGAKK